MCITVLQQPSETNTLDNWATEKAVSEHSGITEAVTVGSTEGPQSHGIKSFCLTLYISLWWAAMGT